MEPVKPISPLKPFFYQWAAEIVQGFSSPCSGRRAAENAAARFHLSVPGGTGRPGSTPPSTDFCVCSPPPPLPAEWHLPGAQAFRHSTGWTRSLWSEAGWVPEEYKCTPSPPAPCPSTKAGKRWARPFQRTLLYFLWASRENLNWDLKMVKKRGSGDEVN